MIETKDSNRSLVIPKWLSYYKIKNSRDLEIPRDSEYTVNETSLRGLFKDFKEFRRKPNIIIASDLLSCAIVLNNKEIASETAKYILKEKNINEITINLAEKILKTKSEEIVTLKYDDEIRRIRAILSNYPKNPIYWIELARCYTIKGEKEKAERAVITALNLAPNDRFIARGGFRFFVHIDDYEKAFYYAYKSAKYSNDPWIKAIEINARILNEMNLTKLKKISFDLIPLNRLFHYSELIESIATLENRLGSDRKAKKLFQLAWNDPSENVIAHGEWVIRNIFPTLSGLGNLDFKKSYEASTWRSFFEHKFQESLSHAINWSLEEPYSTHPFVSGSFIAIYANKLDESVRLAEEGLLSNKNDLSLLNNLAYTYIRLNRLTDAENILSNYPTIIDSNDKIHYYATLGLFKYKQGQIALGRKYYLDSINMCRKEKDRNLFVRAILHLAIAEYEAKTNEADQFVRSALEVSHNIDFPDIQILRSYLEQK